MRCCRVLRRLFNDEYMNGKRCCQGPALLHEKNFTFGHALPHFLPATRLHRNRVAGKKCGNDESIQSAGTLSRLYFEGITTVPASPHEKM